MGRWLISKTLLGWAERSRVCQLSQQTASNQALLPLLGFASLSPTYVSTFPSTIHIHHHPAPHLAGEEFGGQGNGLGQADLPAADGFQALRVQVPAQPRPGFQALGPRA